MGRQYEDRVSLELEILDMLIDSLRQSFGPRSEATHRPMPSFERMNRKDYPDAIVHVETPHGNLDILVEIINTAYPRDIRNAVWRLEELCNTEFRSYLPMVAAKHLSPGAKRDLIERGIAVFDMSGSLFLNTDYFHIDIQRPSKIIHSKTQRPLFTGARESVVHALLENSYQWLTGGELATQAHISSFSCSLVLQELEQREWVESSGGGPTKRRRLVEPGKLLDQWAEAWTARSHEISRWYTFIGDPRDIVKKLSYQLEEHLPRDVHWLFTGAIAANEYAPLLTSIESADIVIPSGYKQEIADTLRLKPASKGSNVSLIERGGASLLFERRPPQYPSYLVSPYIAYLDTLDGRGRNKEQADYLRERIEDVWRRS